VAQTDEAMKVKKVLIRWFDVSLSKDERKSGQRITFHRPLFCGHGNVKRYVASHPVNLLQAQSIILSYTQLPEVIHWVTKIT